MLQTAIVLVIIAAALLFTIRRFVLARKSGCGCGCDCGHDCSGNGLCGGAPDTGNDTGNRTCGTHDDKS